jgi:hypothetical protein
VQTDSATTVSELSRHILSKGATTNSLNPQIRLLQRLKQPPPILERHSVAWANGGRTTVKGLFIALTASVRTVKPEDMNSSFLTIGVPADLRRIRPILGG